MPVHPVCTFTLGLLLLGSLLCAPSQAAAPAPDPTYAGRRFSEAWKHAAERLNVYDERHATHRYRFRDGLLEVRSADGPFPLLVFTPRPGLSLKDALALARLLAPPDMDYARPRPVQGGLEYTQRASESGAACVLTLTKAADGRVTQLSLFQDEP